MGGDDVEVSGELLAEDVEWEIVDVVTEGVFDLGADGCDAVDDVGGDCEEGVRGVVLFDLYVYGWLVGWWEGKDLPMEAGIVIHCSSR